MPQIVWSSHVPPLDGSVKKKAITFIHKLSQNDITNGLHIEPVHGSRDARVRTGRVDDQYRAVMFKLDSRGDVTYIIDSILNHDDAYDRALNIRLRLDANNGMLDVIFDAVDPNTYTPGRSTHLAQPGAQQDGTRGQSNVTPSPRSGVTQPRGPVRPGLVAPQRASDSANITSGPGATDAAVTGVPQQAGDTHSATPHRTPPSQTTPAASGRTRPHDSPAMPPLITATPDSMVAVLGFDRALADAVSRCVTEDQLQALIDAYQHRWEGAVLLELVGDTAVGQVAEILQLQPPTMSTQGASSTGTAAADHQAGGGTSAVPEADGTHTTGSQSEATSTGTGHVDPNNPTATTASHPGNATSGTERPDNVVEETASDEAVHAALQHAANASRFGYVVDDADLRQVIEGGDFARWRKFLHPLQRKFVNKRTNGPFRLTGGAGTGKTVVLMHRAARLLRENPKARVILTTYTSTLADQLRDDMMKLDSHIVGAPQLGDPGLFVVSIDSLAYRVLRYTDQDTRRQAAADVLDYVPTNMEKRPEDTRMRWRRAITATHKNTGSKLTPEFAESEYNAIVLPGRHTTRSTYEMARRKGRGTTMARSARQAFWRVVAEYREQSETLGDVSFPEILAIAGRCLEINAENGKPRPADHVLVDEGQDLTVLHWQMMREMVAEGPDDLFIAEDANQRIYGEKISLADCGIDIRGRAQRLTLNYRTTHQNLKLAQAILNATPYMDTYADDTDGDKSTRSSRTGPKPKLVPAQDFNDECDKTAEIITAWCAGKSFGELPTDQATDPVSPDTIGVLVRTQKNVADVLAALQKRGITCHRPGRVDHGPDSVPVMTMHQAKGLEFAKVIVMSANDHQVTHIIASQGYDDASRSDAVFRERSLLYVATSRARDEVVVTHHGTPSKLLPGRSR